MTRLVDTLIVFCAFIGFILMIVWPPVGWGCAIIVLLALAFGGDA